jgi:hypothetical protein
MKELATKIRNQGVVAATAATGVVLSATAVNAQTGGISGGIEAAKPTGAEENLFGDGGIFQTVANILLFIVGAVSVIMLIIGGIRYVVSAGDQQAVTNAKNTILYAIVGIVIAFLAFAAVRFVIDQLEGN